MQKQAISVTLERENLSWLRAQAAIRGCRSVSQLLDSIIAEARSHGRSPVRSVVGTIRIDPNDPGLEHADTAVRELFLTSILDG